MRRWPLLLTLPVLLVAIALSRTTDPGARIASAATPVATPQLTTASSRTAPLAVPQQTTTEPLNLTGADCTGIPQLFTVNGAPRQIQLNYPGATLSTNAPATGVSSITLANDITGKPLTIPPAVSPATTSDLVLAAGGLPQAGGQEILAQPFVRPSATNASVILTVPGQTPQIVSCATSAVPLSSRNLLVDNPPFGLDALDCSVGAFQGFCGEFCPGLLPSATSTPNPSTSNTCPNNCLPSPISPIPCATIQYAIGQARDGDTITIASTLSPYVIDRPIEVPILVTITSDGNNKVVLSSANGDPIFHVTAVGSSQQHVTIQNLILGGTTSAANPGAIQLDGDSFTTVQNNFIGQEDLPNGIGIVLHNSDHPTITGNTIRGSTVFTEAGELQVGAVTSGFGIVTAECLGTPEPSDSITISNNLIAANANAGIWLCSDQGGGHQVTGNALRSNARGIVLFNVVDSKLDSNVIDDNLGDGIQVVGESANDTVSNNTIESQTGKDSAGIRLYGNGGIVFPLNTAITGNNLRRNTFDVVIAGARATTLSNNTIEAGDYRTGVYLLVGSLLGGGSSSQPTDTVLNGNMILYDGFCSASAGCAIRLAPGVVTTVDAHTNNFGFPATSLTEIRTIIWDQSEDPSLGQVIISGTPPTPGSGSAPPPTAVPSATPQTAAPTATATPSPSATSSAPAGATAICSDGTPTFNTDTTAGCSTHGGVRQTLNP